MPNLLVDYMYAAGQSPAAIKSFGYVGVMRYLAPLPNSKVMTKAEAFALHAAGLGIGLVWEWTNNRAGAGAAAGTVDAQRAEAQADALGYPSDCPIFYAIDYDVGGPAVAPYFQGIAQAARRPVGVYGPRPAVDWMIANRLAVYGWQAAGWVHGADSQVAHLKQLVGSKLIPNTDVNEMLKPFPTWGLADPVTNKPTGYLEDDDMLMVQDQSTGKLYCVAGNTKLEFPTGGGVNGPNSPGHGNLYADAIQAMTGQPQLIAGSHDVLSRIPNALDTLASAVPPPDPAKIAAALATDPTFVQALAGAVKSSAAQEYAGTFKPVQP